MSTYFLSRATSLRLPMTRLILTAGALPGAIACAFAQEVVADRVIDAATTLDAVIVTANKRVENVQEVPKSVLVVSPETLSKSGVTTISELGNLIPSIGGMVDPRSSTPPLRGISSFGTSVGVQAQTGVVIDDVPQASYSSLFKELTDIDSVEVLPGPQSTLSGRNASAGLINIRTREPGEYFAAEASFEQTSDRQQRMTGFMSGPITRTLAFSVNAFSNEWEGHLRSMAEMNGSRHLHLDGWDIHGARGKLRWQPNDRFNSTLTVYTMENTFFPVAYFASGAYFAVDPNAVQSMDTQGRTIQELFPGMQVRKYNRWTGANTHGTHKNHDRGSTLRMEYTLGNGASLLSISSLAKVDMPRQDAGISFDGQFIADPSSKYSQIHYNTETKTQEFRLVSPGGQTFDYLIGVVYSDTDTWFPLQRRGFASPSNWIRMFDMQSAALFARGTWDVNSKNALTLGLRYQDDKMGWSWAFLPARADVTLETAPDVLSQGGSQYDFFSAEASWRHMLAEGVSAYLTMARAESGKVYDMGNAADARNGTLQPLDSQKVNNVEIGLKSFWLERRLMLNINAFNARYDHYQIRAFDFATTLFRLSTIGKVETRGVEIETRFRATSQLDFSAGAAWVDAFIKDLPGAQCWVRQTASQGCINGVQENLRGTAMPHAPKFKMLGSVNYFMPLDALPFDLEWSGSWRWQSKTWFDYRGNPNLVQDRYGVLNLSATLRERDGRYTLSVFVNNALNKHFYSNIIDDEGWTRSAYSGSFARDSFRYFGANLKFHF